MKNLIPVILAILVLFACLMLDMHLHDGNATLLSYIPGGIAALFVLAVVLRAVANSVKAFFRRVKAFFRRKGGTGPAAVLVLALLSMALSTGCRRVPALAVEALVLPMPVMVTDSAGWTYRNQ